MPERPLKESQMDADDLDIFKTFGSVESWRRTVLPLAAPVHHPSGHRPAPTGSFSTSPQAATVPEATFLAVPPIGRTSLSPRNAAAPPSSQEASASTSPYPASDPLGFFVKRPVKARSVAPERTLSLSSCGSANPINLTRTPSLSEASSYAGDHLLPHKGTTASSDCPSSPPFLPMATDLGPSLSLSAGPSPLSSPAALRPEEDLVHPPPVSLLSALLASHSHHTKALTQAQNVNSNHSSALPSSFASPASSMPNSTASSPGLGGFIHPHLAQTARQRRFSSGAGDVLENVGEDVEAEELESNGQNELPSVPPPPAQQPRLTFLTELQQRSQLTSKARIGIPSAKPPSIFLASSPAPSMAPSAAASVRKSSIVFIDDPEIAARRGVADPASAASSAPPSEPATDAASSQLQTSTPELSPAPPTRAPLNPPHPTPAVCIGSSAVPPPLVPTPRRGLSFMLPSSDHARQAPPSLSATIATTTSQTTDVRPPTPVKKASGLTFAVATVCARPKALGPEKSVGALEDDDDEDDDEDDEGQGASDEEEEDNDEGDEDGDDDDEDDEEESEGEGKGLDVLAEEDDDDEQGYEEDDEGEGSDGYNVGERDGERYRFRRTDLFGHDSDDDDSTGGASDSDQAFDETASIRTKTSGRGSIFSNFSGLAPLEGGAFGEGEEGEDMSSTYRPGSLQHRRSSSLRNQGSWHRHSPSLPPIQAADPADLLALEAQTPTQSTSSPAPAPPPRRRPLFSFIRGRRGGAAPRSPHHAPRLLSNGVAAFSPGLPRMQEGLAHPPPEPEPEPICRDDFLPTHLKSERGKEKQREAELRELMSSTDGGGGGAPSGVGRNGKCSRHRSPPPSSSGRDRSQDASRIKSRTKRGTKPAKYTALDDLSGTLRPKPSLQLHASDSGIRTTPPVTRKTTRRRSDNHGTLRPRLTGHTAATAVFLSEADVLAPPIVRIRSRPIPTPRPRSWDGDDGGFV